MVAPKGSFRPSASPAPTAADPTMNERRLSSGVVIMASTPLGLRRCVDGLTHLLEGSAPADVGDGAVDVGVGRLGLVLEQGGHGHDHPGLAIAALRNLVFDPGLLDLVQGPARGE